MSSEIREFLSTPAAQTVIWSTVLVFLVLLGCFIVKWFRDRHDQDHQSASDLLTDFRELNLDGDISDKEFRNIKSVLGNRLQNELRDPDQEA